jgi:DNA-directed RNA polymerase specialized sigma24 family protein
MKNYAKSDCAVNKFSKSIVHRFVDCTVEVTLTDYLTENPDKTLADFIELKELSDKIYREQDRDDYRQTWKNSSLGNICDVLCATPSSESILISALEQNEQSNSRISLAKRALNAPTDVQRKRYLLHVVNKLTTRQIAEKEGVKHQSVVESLQSAEKKIKKVLSES